MPIRLNTKDVHLDRIHSQAVWQEIGERLLVNIDSRSSDMSQHLSRLIERLPELDRADAPSLVPDMESVGFR